MTIKIWQGDSDPAADIKDYAEYIKNDGRNGGLDDEGSDNSGLLWAEPETQPGANGEDRQVVMNSDGGCCGWVYHSSDGIEVLEADIALLQHMLTFLKTGKLDA